MCARSATRFTRANRKSWTPVAASNASTAVSVVAGSPRAVRSPDRVTTGWAERALLGSALFVCLVGCAPQAPARCTDWPAQRWVASLHAVDGDTLRTPSGERIRLIGVNSPELGKDRRAAEPFSRRARDELQDFLERGGRFAIREGDPARDRFGRTLAHVRRHVAGEAGWDLSARQLYLGLGMQVVVGSNVEQVGCYQRMERSARTAGRGIWGHPAFAPVAAGEVGAKDAGFLQLRGKVVSVETSRSAYWLELDGPVAIRLARSYFSGRGVGDGLVGRTVVTRGWLVDRGQSRAVRERGHPRFLMRVDHPAIIDWQSEAR